MSWQLIHRSCRGGVARLGRFASYIWAGPNSLLGLLAAIAALASGGSCRVVDGVLEVEGKFVRLLLERCTLLKGGASAITLGHVVIGRTRELLDTTRAHERVHVRQYERWGPFFMPAYGAASVVAWLRGGRPYRDNWFEKQAYETS